MILLICVDLLRLLEGHHCTPPAPMNSCSEHIKLTADNDIPVLSQVIPRFFKHDENEPQKNEHEANSQAWRNLTETDIRKLQTLQLKLLKIPISTSNYFMFLLDSTVLFNLTF